MARRGGAVGLCDLAVLALLAAAALLDTSAAAGRPLVTVSEGGDASALVSAMEFTTGPAFEVEAPPSSAAALEKGKGKGKKKKKDKAAFKSPVGVFIQVGRGATRCCWSDRVWVGRTCRVASGAHSGSGHCHWDGLGVAVGKGLEVD